MPDMHKISLALSAAALSSLAIVLAAAPSAPVADRTCATSTTLEALATCIRTQMPQSGSNGFVEPSLAEQADWRWTVNQMLGGACNFALPSTLTGIAQVRTFTDSGNGRAYCLLMEVADANNNGYVDRGWGTFITYDGATREISHQAPHPISDSTTESQAMGVFKGTDSRSYLMAGAHRLANAAASTCQASYGQADAAHNTANMFHATNLELMAWYGANDWHAIQWHGMAADTCANTDVYLSHGRNVTPTAGDPVSVLRSNALSDHPSWDLDVTGAGVCSLNGTDNTQGRVINGVAVANACGTSATGYTGRFLHIEQDPGFRSAADWIGPVADTWPAIAPPTVPPAPSGLTATATSSSQITLGWVDNAANEDGFTIERSTDNNTFTPLATVAASATGGVDTALTAATTYYYRLRAFNVAGVSDYSNIASATTQAPPPPPPPTPPAAPTNLKAQTDRRTIKLTWTASSSPNITHIRVYRSTVSGGPYALIATLPKTTKFTNTGLTIGTTYHYVVAAVNSSGAVSGYSNQASKTAR